MKKVRGGEGNADSYNYGLAVLKIVMSFVVVLCHYWAWDDYLSLPVYLNVLSEYVPLLCLYL